ncbi:phage portal protein [Streptomyces sp. Isolate_219]|uniref:phage portal protein n=1 Tax=Streptomyces sp. Isolate_219 TaxID=2950110 RepID=UPI0021CA1804|nr:phage portal protein [Streptomyces sp. Isolate_219]MCR8576473.1 phage portal protein [Streptomyces sp. Isolate_219]
MIDSQTPGSPGWWFKRLAEKQVRRLPELHRLHRYAVGDADLPEGDNRVRETFQKFQRKARSNYIGLLCESLLERLRVTGFRAGSDATSADDKDAWAMWQANSMDADIPLGFRAALYMREAYLFIGPPNGSAGKYPVITVEDPREMIAEMDPLRKRRPLAVLKMWNDTIVGQRRALLMVGGDFHSYTAPLQNEASYAYDGFSLDSWTASGSAPNPAGRPPVVRLANRMDIDGTCLAEAEDVIDIQDRINNQILDRLVISKMQAYRQRWVTGASFEDEDGNPMEPFKPGADLVWAVEDETAKFGDFSQADLTPILSAVRDDVRDMAAISRTPAHYLLGEFINAAGDAFDASETGLVAKAKERMAHFGEAIEEAIRIGYLYLKDPRADAFDSEVQWGDPQRRALAEMADAATKLSAAGVPWRTLMGVLNFTPQEIDRMAAERASDALLASALTPPPAPTPNTPQDDTAPPEEPPAEPQ